MSPTLLRFFAFSTLVGCSLLFFVIGIYHPVQATTPHFSVEAVPLLLSAPVGLPTSIIPFNGDDLLVSTPEGKLFLLNRPSAPDEIWETSLYLDLSAVVSQEQQAGLFDIEPAPTFPSSPHLYLSYVNLEFNLIIARYNTETQILDTVLVVPHPDRPDIFNHRGGDLAFHNGLLYFSIGDHSEWKPPEPNHPAQRLDSWLGKIIRIDVETANPLTYTIPIDNPYINTPDALPEIWAYGFRNPWKLTFDPVTEEMLIADVGDEAWEEINRMPSDASGLNFGWRCYEGPDRYEYQEPDCEGISPTAPIFAYPHGTYNDRYQCSITGGHVYRGTLYPNLTGMYIYTDFCASRIWGLKEVGDDFVNYPLFDLLPNNYPTAMGVDHEGTLYIGGSQRLYQIVDTAPAGATPIPTPTYPNRLYLPLSTKSLGESD
jgi:glucose/arabinose dehydrogenase